MSSLTNSNIRTRFAPSPTGYLHVGGLRTALFNYLFARHHGGIFILRIEDTDRARYVEGATENLIEMLHWAGIDADEGPSTGGDYGPYFQSQRLQHYRDYADQLLSQEHAYYAFDTPEELQQMRRDQQKRGEQYQKYDRTSMRNSLTLPESEVKDMLAQQVPHVLRLFIPENREIVFEDIVRGEVTFHSREIDDQILIKSDGYPTYHLANVVDDHLMKISHVVRGEEWLSSVPKHLLLYEYLDWEMPTLAHLPLIFNPDGSKMSKRDSGKEFDGKRFDPDVATYREAGYFKEALINYVMLLGWNPGEGDERQIFSINELIEDFSLERVSKAKAVFDLTKLEWVNAQHLKRKNDRELLDLILPLIQEKKLEYPDETYLLSIISLLKERVKFPHEFISVGQYFFKDPQEYDAKGVKKYWREGSSELLKEFASRIKQLPQFDKLHLENVVREIAEERKIGAGKIIHPTRLAVSGSSVGPGLFELLEILSKETVMRRLQRAAEKL